MVKARQWLLANRPSDHPILSGPDQTFQLTEKELPALKENELLVKTIYISNDPAQRGWITAREDPSRLYIPPVQINAVMNARGVCEVIESTSSKYAKGDTVQASCGWSDYAVVSESDAYPAPELPGGRSKTHHLGALGVTGLTAYFGLMEATRVQKEDIVVVSGAAGATGSMVVQIAKKIVGCKKVIGIAGTDEKCKWVETLGADLCLNYKSADFQEELKKALPGPDGWANLYFDNVGGEILDLMLGRMARFGRIAACGAISNYNQAAERTTGIKKWFEIISMRLEIKGFIVLDYRNKFPEAIEVFQKALEEGKITLEGGETVVDTKFEDVPKTWVKLFDGSNTGKLVTKLV